MLPPSARIPGGGVKLTCGTRYNATATSCTGAERTYALMRTVGELNEAIAYGVKLTHK